MHRNLCDHNINIHTLPPRQAIIWTLVDYRHWHRPQRPTTFRLIRTSQLSNPRSITNRLINMFLNTLHNFRNSLRRITRPLDESKESIHLLPSPAY